LYSIIECKNKTVSEVSDLVNNGNGEEFTWRLLWRRDMFECEEELKQQLFNWYLMHNGRKKN